jgi:hypothetical protein
MLQNPGVKSRFEYEEVLVLVLVDFFFTVVFAMADKDTRCRIYDIFDLPFL